MFKFWYKVQLVNSEVLVHLKNIGSLDVSHQFEHAYQFRHFNNLIKKILWYGLETWRNFQTHTWLEKPIALKKKSRFY
jgi:hypothetical protein